MDAVATRVDPEMGIREIADFFGPNGSRLFGVSHLPLGDVAGALVVCSPLYAEAVRNYRREVVLARGLAQLGVAVQRFHYRGFGNSDGESGDLSFDTLRADALAAVERIVQRAGVTRLAFLGTRLGTLVAASVAAQFAGAPLVLWDPIIDGTRYFREVFRYRAIHEMREGAAAPRGGVSFLERLMTAGSVDVLGHTIHKALYESTVGHSLTADLGHEARAVLLFQFGNPRGLRREYADVVAGWRTLQFVIDVEYIDGEEPWWFGARIDNMQPMNERAEWLIRPSVRWITQQLTGRGRPHGTNPDGNR